MSKPYVTVAGATGQLGHLIAASLRSRDIPVQALIRPHTDPSRTTALRDLGVTISETDLNDVPALRTALDGTTTLVSALNGLSDVILTAQRNLLDAAVQAHVRRFIPSDYALDFTKTQAGTNRNLDLRREFHTILEQSGIEQWTSILNGAFTEILAGQAPLILDKWGRVLYWGSNPDQKLDFTTYADAAAYTAAVAADERETPKILRIAGDVKSARELGEIAGRVNHSDDGDGGEGKPYTPLWVGSVGFLEGAAGLMRRFGLGGSEKDVFPAWQGMQYTVNMFSGAGKLDPLDNDRYPELKWTKVEDFLRQLKEKKVQA
ncbi:NmrA-like protein [Coniella lustricola]|uniref:NmrA-like protein n=1 Tax=Coniella lustricola TaxID=2025994 RepID=A0A2T3A7J9_9PEZI|nr:NmrA-like protein [Coniella lustricola]